MHEQAIAQEIIRKAQAEEQRRGKLRAITVEVGAVAHLPAAEMREVLSTIAPWKVTVVEKPAKVACTCGLVGEPVILEKGHDHNLFKCPSCGEMMPKVLEGHDIVLQSVEVE